MLSSYIATPRARARETRNPQQQLAQFVCPRDLVYETQAAGVLLIALCARAYIYNFAGGLRGEKLSADGHGHGSELCCTLLRARSFSFLSLVARSIGSSFLVVRFLRGEFGRGKGRRPLCTGDRAGTRRKLAESNFIYLSGDEMYSSRIFTFLGDVIGDTCMLKNVQFSFQSNIYRNSQSSSRGTASILHTIQPRAVLQNVHIESSQKYNRINFSLTESLNAGDQTFSRFSCFIEWKNDIFGNDGVATI